MIRRYNTTSYILDGRCFYLFIFSLPACTGNGALGMESGVITKQQITASSSWNKYHGPDNARLNLVRARGKTGSWSAASNDANQWLQVDFSRNMKISRFATQGRQDSAQWVTRYKLAYSPDGQASAFQIYQENGVDQVR